MAGPAARGWPPRNQCRMIIDAHHHLWDPGARRHAWLDALPSLRRPFGLDDFTPLARAHG